MKTTYRISYGSPEVINITEVDKPVPKNDEVLIKVYATTVNRTDCGILWGQPWIIKLFTGFPRPRNHTTGTDFAGVVEEVGKEVSSFHAGDRVWGFDDNSSGTHAQYITLNERQNMMLMPNDISFEEAAASAEGAHYAYNFIKKLSINEQTKVLVNGATGAIGTAAVQILKDKGAQITAVANTENLSLVNSLGAHKVIDYQKEDFTQLQEKFDLILDAVGKSSFFNCLPLLKPKGIYISSELGWMAQNIFLALLTPILGGKKVQFPIPTDCKASLMYIKELIEKNAFKAVIDRAYPLEQIRQAFSYVHSGQKTGNVIILYQTEG